MGVENVALLSDFDGEATRAFGVAQVSRGMTDVTLRSAFLITDGIVAASWLLRSEMPDIDAVIAAASTGRPQRDTVP